MNAFSRSISQILKGSAKAFRTFPATIAFALAFSVVTAIRIQLDWPEQEAYNFLFNCLHWAFALGAVFSLMSTTFTQSRLNTKRAFVLANLAGVAAAAIAFVTLYLFGGSLMDEFSRYQTVSVLARARVTAALSISFLAFIIIAGHPKEQSDFARSFFMTHKAFFIALIYGAVIMGGFSGVARAVQALLYQAMSYKVYMYLGTLAGFLAFTIFVGYFPSFRKSEIDKHRETAQKHPRFIEVLFGYIMIPIILALTIVLLAWAGKTIATGSWPSFIMLSGIATSYAVGGIWLHVMVTHYESGLAKFYKLVYPIAALVILAFEAWALVVQLSKYSLKTTEYFFILVWVLTVVAAVLLIIIKSKAHIPIIVLICALAVLAVLPSVGYQSLPVYAQANRLQGLLADNGMLQGDKILPAAKEPALSVREAITDSVSFLANARDVKLPAWFDKKLNQGDIFKSRLGFEQKWPDPENFLGGGSGDYLSTSLMLPAGAVDISGYRWAVNVQAYETQYGYAKVTVNGDKGTYDVNWTYNPPSGVPYLKIVQDGRVILDKDMNDYIDIITEKFPPNNGKPVNATLEDMSVRFETPELSVLLVFDNININANTRYDTIEYWFNLDALYLQEKP